MLKSAFAVAAVGASLTFSTVVAGLPTQSRAEESAIATVLSKHAGSVVTVKFLLAMQENEREAEAGGLVIDPAGLILVSNLEIGGSIGRGRESAQAKEIRVLIGDDTQGLPAKIIGRDTELELAWVQLDKPAEKPLAFVDPAKGVTVKVGDELVAIDRMNKYYDRVAVGLEFYVGGLTTKPRNLIIPSGGPLQWIGLPVFSEGGGFVGVSVVQPVGGDEDEPMAQRNMGRVSPFDRGLKVLPAAEVASATARAIEAHKSGKELGAEEAKPAAKPEVQPGEKPEGDGMPGEKP